MSFEGFLYMYLPDGYILPLKIINLLKEKGYECYIYNKIDYYNVFVKYGQY